MAEQFSWVLLPYHSPPRHLSNKSFCFVSSYVSMDNSFPSVRQDPTLGPWKGFPCLQQYHRLNPCPLHWQVDFFLPLSHQGSPHEEEKLKFYITSHLFCLCNSVCSCLDHTGHSLRKWGLRILGTEAYLLHPCLALCNCPAPENMLNACPYKGQASPSLS